MFDKPPRRRYNSDLLVYEAFYVSLRNSLIVTVLPLALFIFLVAIEIYPRPEEFLSTMTTMMEIIFIISFFINFLYYVYFIKLRKIYACLLTVLISFGLAVAIFFSDLKDILTDMHQAVIVSSWFLLLAVIIVFNKIGAWPDKESRYDSESWLYRHELTTGHDEEDETDPEDKYVHRYVENPSVIEKTPTNLDETT